MTNKDQEREELGEREKGARESERKQTFIHIRAYDMKRDSKGERNLDPEATGVLEAEIQIDSKLLKNTGLENQTVEIRKEKRKRRKSRAHQKKK